MFLLPFLLWEMACNDAPSLTYTKSMLATKSCAWWWKYCVCSLRGMDSPVPSVLALSDNSMPLSLTNPALGVMQTGVVTWLTDMTWWNHWACWVPRFSRWAGKTTCLLTRQPRRVCYWTLQGDCSTIPWIQKSNGLLKLTNANPMTTEQRNDFTCLTLKMKTRNEPLLTYKKILLYRMASFGQ